MRTYGPTEVSGGAILASACGHPPLTARDLAKPINR
jgi:hypothetical protein